MKLYKERVGLYCINVGNCLSELNRKEVGFVIKVIYWFFENGVHRRPSNNDCESFLKENLCKGKKTNSFDIDQVMCRVSESC